MSVSTVTLTLPCSIQVGCGNTALAAKREVLTGTGTTRSRLQSDELMRCCLMSPSFDAIEYVAAVIPRRIAPLPEMHMAKRWPASARLGWQGASLVK